MFRSTLVLAAQLWLALTAASPTLATSPDYCALLAKISDADPDKDPRRQAMTRQQICLAYYWIEFKARPAEQLLETSDFEGYENALQQGDCSTALRLLRTAFTKTYGQAPAIVRDDNVYRSWRNNAVGAHFPELALCREYKQFTGTGNASNLTRHKDQPYKGWRKSLAPEIATKIPAPTLDRYMLIYGWELRVQRTGHPGTALTLLRLSRRGNSVRYHALTEAYLAARAQAGGLSGKPIEEALAVTLSRSDAESLKRAKKSGDFRSVLRYAD